MTSDTAERLGAKWAEVLKCGAPVPDESDFFDAGGTSIAAVHLAAAIQEQFGVGVDAIEVITVRRFDGIVDLIDERRAIAPGG